MTGYTFMTRSINGTNKLYPTQLDPPPPIRPDVVSWAVVVGGADSDS